MSGESFRFIHASDFHLESPLGDLDSVPSHLSEAMAEAPRRAATAVFEAALADNIDFVVLCGDLLSPQSAGPHGMSLLLDHFEKLHQKKTPVFWSAGIADDPAKWPDSVPLPPNVTLFPKNRAIMFRSNAPDERFAPSSDVAVTDDPRCTFRATASIRPTISPSPSAMATATLMPLAEGRFDYWALGGEHDREEIEGGAESGAWYCGTPQGRCLDENVVHMAIRSSMSMPTRPLGFTTLIATRFVTAT